MATAASAATHAGTDQGILERWVHMPSSRRACLLSACGGPTAAFGTGAGLADVQPPSNVDLLEVEVEEGIVRDGLDHAADPASRNNLQDQCSRSVVRHLDRIGADAQLVVLCAWQRVDDTTRVSAEIPPFG
jgi:hypothetical protein